MQGKNCAKSSVLKIQDLLIIIRSLKIPNARDCVFDSSVGGGGAVVSQSVMETVARAKLSGKHVCLCLSVCVGIVCLYVALSLYACVCIYVCV